MQQEILEQILQEKQRNPYLHPIIPFQFPNSELPSTPETIELQNQQIAHLGRVHVFEAIAIGGERGQTLLNRAESFYNRYARHLVPGYAISAVQCSDESNQEYAAEIFHKDVEIARKIKVSPSERQVEIKFLSDPFKKVLLKEEVDIYRLILDEQEKLREVEGELTEYLMKHFKLHTREENILVFDSKQQAAD